MLRGPYAVGPRGFAPHAGGPLVRARRTTRDVYAPWLEMFRPSQSLSFLGVQRVIEVLYLFPKQFTGGSYLYLRWKPMSREI